MTILMTGGDKPLGLLDILENDELYAEFFESLLLSDDPTPWCTTCSAARKRDCHCGPIDPMD